MLANPTPAGETEEEFQRLQEANAGRIYVGWAEPDIPIGKQLAGKGQIKDLRSNKNLKAVDINDLLTRTPEELEQMVKDGELSPKTLKQIKKAFEGRDLGKRGKNR